MTRKPRIATIATGGTIDSLGATRLDLAEYASSSQRLDFSELIASMPELSDIAEIEQISFRRMSSYELTDRDWLELRSAVVSNISRVDGVVITHGTNTLEETAFFLHLSLSTDKPVVIVGAMRPAGSISADGPLNLIKAVMVAASENSRGLGALVVLNDTIFSARDVTKTATFRVHAFAAPDTGPLGVADADGVVRIYHRPVRQAGMPVDLEGLTGLPRVDIVVSFVGADGHLVDAAVAAGAKGIVSAGTGAGKPTPMEQRSLDLAADAGVVVCRSSRVGSGRVPRPPDDANWVTADNLPPWKARVALALALTKTSDVQEVQRLLDAI